MDNKTKLARIAQIIDSPFDGVDIPDKQRKVANLHALGLTTPEIAAQLGLSVDSVKVYRMKACNAIGLNSYRLTRLVFEKIQKVLDE